MKCNNKNKPTITIQINKSIMKKTILSLAFFCICITCITIQSQQKIRYTYDNAGNRIERKIILTKSFNKMKEAQVLNEVLAERTVKIYPNPTKGSLTVSLGDQDSEVIGEIFIFGLNGQMITTRKIKSNMQTFDLSNEPTGTYIMKIIIDGKSSSWKIIKE